MDSNDKKQRASQELDVLKGVIDYADRMIYEEGKRGEYDPLRRHAYGKTVVVDTEYLGKLTFRLSSTPVVYPNASSGYATPHSPVGRLCSFVKEGDENESNRWGEYKVLEVRLFDRFSGEKFESNVRNFLHMEIRSLTEKDKVTDLKSFVKEGIRQSVRIEETLAKEKEETDRKSTGQGKPTSQDKPVQITYKKRKLEHAIQNSLSQEKQNDASVSDEKITSTQNDEIAISTPKSKISITSFDVDETESEGQFILESDEEEFESVDKEDDAYFGLGESFYINRTQQQDAVISRSPVGVMYVEGVAGSGKTSAALGRTKMLCDFNVNSVSDEADFKDIVGEQGDYWAKQFAGQFSQESSVGFVRTGELIQYLKETCRRLDLPNLPVLEYPELRSRLRETREVMRAAKGNKRWLGLDDQRHSYIDTTMDWLFSADKAIAQYLSRKFRESRITAEQVSDAFLSNEQKRAFSILLPAVESFSSSILDIAKDIVSPQISGRFALDGLAKRIDESINNTRESILGANTLWLIVGEQYLYAKSERELAVKLVNNKFSLYTQSSARLVYCDENGLLDNNLILLDGEGIELSDDKLKNLLQSKDNYYVKDLETSETFTALIIDVDNLYLRLLPETSQRTFYRQEKGLKRIILSKGLGLLNFPILSQSKNNNNDEEDAEGNEQKTVNRSLSFMFANFMRRTFLQPLSFLTDIYQQAIDNFTYLFPDGILASKIIDQFNQRKLANEDIDLILCLYHLVGRNYEGNVNNLRTPSYYQSVFIDEVQDFTEQQVYLMAEQARPEYFAVTVVGDQAQKLHNGSAIDVPICFPGRNVESVQLNKNMRQADAPGIAWFSARFRAHLQKSSLGEIPNDELLEHLINAADSVIGPEFIISENDQDFVEKTVAILKKVNRHETAVVILPTEELAEQFHKACRPILAEDMIDTELSERIDLSRRHVKHFTSITNAKGLEFDLVIMPYFEYYDLTDSLHQNRMYVGLTRARRRLVLMGHKDRPRSEFDIIWKEYQDILAIAQ